MLERQVLTGGVVSCCVTGKDIKRLSSRSTSVSVSVKDGPRMFHSEFLCHSFVIAVSKAPLDKMNLESAKSKRCL